MSGEMTDWVRRIHRGPVRLVLVAAGGGAEAATRLLAEAGASRSVLEVVVPYAPEAYRAFAPGLRGKAVSRERAVALADRAYDRAEHLAGAGGGIRLGVACTAALATDRKRRGPDQAFVCLRLRDRRAICRLDFDRGPGSRAEQETAITRLLLAAMASVESGISAPGARFVEEPSAGSLASIDPPGHWIVVHRDGQWQPGAKPAPILYPGSFHPLHRGHVRLARAVEEDLGQPVDLELSVQNADKPSLAGEDLDRRVAGIQGRFRVVLTRVPRFIDKARLFPGRTFIVGFDTARRLIDPAYYADNPGQRDAALSEMRGLDCRFVVAGRLDNEAFMTLPALSIPADFAPLFAELPGERFREDISATALRESS